MTMFPAREKRYTIARKPAPKAKFQVSPAPGALRLAGSNRDETIERVQVSGVRCQF